MLNTNYFVDSIILEEELFTELHARLLTAVHMCISDGATLGVDWPEFVSGKTFGRILRVFGSVEGLAAYKEMIKPLSKAKLVLVYGHTRTPECSVWRSFYRCRKSEEGTEAVLRYKAARAARKGKIFTPSKAERVVAKDYLKMVSISNEQRFSLFIRLDDAHEAPVAAAPPSGYGLGGYVPHFGDNDE
jgi:CRISPR-associated endoribonuclease Cas6/Csy4 subtype I-F